VEAETLEDALECMAHRPFDVILTDLGLPDENGIEVVERLRRASNEAAVIVTSGNEDEELAVRAIAVGAQDFLVKSFLEPMQLRRAIRFAIERKRTELRLAHLAGTDELTGLINRGTLTKRIVETLSRTRRSKTEFGVIYIDLDGFKPVNDRLGHKAGDELLCRVAHRMRGVVREYDACSRIGGDEFAVLIETPCNQDDAIAITNRLVDALNEPFVLSGGASVTIGASAGLAMHPQMGATPDRLLHAADQAMYRAKHAGGGRCMVAGYSSLAPASLESRLRSAVALENLELHFQPIVQCADGQLTAVEALLRWHPTADESIPPSVFVPLLEETGLINDVGSWIIDETLRQLSRWHRLGAHSLRAHVNVSPQQFENGELIENVRDSLERHSVAAQCLELEITESTLMQNTRASNATLSALKDLGLRLAIDDFGTGYSSLAYLHRFRVDTLKVDRAFVDDLGRSAHADAITSAILSLAQQLELEVVAEGIETPEQLSFVRQLRCPFAQGYLFAKPAPGAIIDAWIARGPESIVVPQQL
ncbi:MAG: GGDEF domain-containing response regulator, partial [Myxococcota bacterium]